MKKNKKKLPNFYDVLGILKTKPCKMVKVMWYDARFFSGTYKKKECNNHNMCLFESLGYIISKDKTTLRIAAEKNNEGEYRDITLIPTGSIVEIRNLSMSKLLKES